MSEVPGTDCCCEDSKPSKWNIVEWVCYILPSAADVRFAPSMKDNPPPLVSVEEIRNARDLCPARISGCCLLEINDSTILKVGYTVQMGEAEAMVLVRNQTSAPVPQVYNAYTIDDIGFIVMEKISGVQLEACWESLTRTSKESIAKQLQDYVSQWRQIEGPFLGSVNGGPCLDVIFKHPWENKEYNYGPFCTRLDFNKGMVEALQNSRPGQQLKEKDVLFANQLLASGSGQDEAKILTHGDLHLSNIIVKDDVIAGIVDWGAAGYSVPAREYFCLRWTAVDPEWIELSTTVLPADEYDFWKEVNYQMMAYTCI